MDSEYSDLLMHRDMLAIVPLLLVGNVAVPINECTTYPASKSSPSGSHMFCQNLLHKADGTAAMGEHVPLKDGSSDHVGHRLQLQPVVKNTCLQSYVNSTHAS